MKVAISGASGFIGTYLTGIFIEKGYGVAPLYREIFNSCDTAARLRETLSGCDVVINLAGSPINHRWSKAYKKVLYSSRIDTTRRIVEAINSLERKPALFISVSAVGYYPSEGCYDEYNSVRGEGFLAYLCETWEQESRKVSPEVRQVNTRFGVVLAARGGAFSRMTLPVKLGVATIIASGKQSFSWIALSDLGRAMEFIIQNPEISGVVNFVAPQQMTNREFTVETARRYHSLFTVRIPRLFFRMAMGESADFIVEGQCVKPAKLTGAGFVFEYDSISKVLKSV